MFVLVMVLDTPALGLDTAGREELPRARQPNQPRDCRWDLMGRQDLYQVSTCLYQRVVRLYWLWSWTRLVWCWTQPSEKSSRARAILISRATATGT